MDICSQKLASIQPRTSRLKLGGIRSLRIVARIMFAIGSSAQSWRAERLKASLPRASFSAGLGSVGTGSQTLAGTSILDLVTTSRIVIVSRKNICLVLFFTFTSTGFLISSPDAGLSARDTNRNTRLGRRGEREDNDDVEVPVRPLRLLNVTLLVYDSECLSLRP